MTSRRIWKIPRAGSLDRLRLCEEPLSELQPGEARIGVRAVGLNFADLFALQGLYSATPAGEFTPGLEFAGVIEEIRGGHQSSDNPRRSTGQSSDSRSSYKPGDRVMGAIRFGAYADRLNADLRYVRPIPAGWDFAQGAALPAQGLTAYYALRDLGNLRDGQLVLIHSVAGGVGLLALAITRALGARVVGTVGSEEKLPFLTQSMGMAREEIIVRDARRFREQLRAALVYHERDGFDLVLDAVAGQYFRPAYDSLRPAGRLLLFGAATMMTHGSRPNYARLAWRYLRRPHLDPLAMISENKSLMAFNLIWLWDRIDELTRLYDDLLRLNLPAPHIGRRFAFTEAPAALRYFQSGRSTGKVVLEIGAEAGRQ